MQSSTAHQRGINVSAAVGEFLRKVLRSGLLDREQLKQTLRSLAKDRRDQLPAIAEHLLQAEKLTRFQIHKISQGITVGLVLGPYQLLAPLGRGGMGTVYLARDTRDRQYVALKILPPKLARAEERLLARFRREAELSQKVQHDHLARTLESGVHHNIHYIAMEFIPGQTLYRVVATQGPLSIARAAHLFAEAAAALGHAHRQGVIHRDMKPSNLMVTPHDHAKVLDLGLAYTQGEEVEDIEVLGGRGYIVGSIDYMAPEQTRDPTAVDARADLYALGCCFYFALTGRPVFPEGTVYQKVRAHRHEEPNPIRQLNPAIPEEFAAIIHKLLAKQPAERFASADELVEALRPWRAGGEQTLDVPGDAAFQDAVKNIVANWMPMEVVKDEDAILFGIAPDDRPATSEFTPDSVFGEADPANTRFWTIVAVSFWLGLLLLCLLGTCMVAAIR
jgi:serine/threonine protein kinase